MNTRFSVGDLVRPKPAFLTDERNNPVPSGTVIKVEPYGRGQMIHVEGGRERGYLAGMFERVEQLP